MATIVTKNSSTASAVPTTSDLVQGELAVNVTDKRIFTENASTQIVELGTNPSTITTATATVTGTLTANGTFASSNAVLTGGTVNGIVIGGTTPQAITGTTVTASTGFVGGLTGNVTGNLTGNVTGNVTGNLTGNVTGNVTASSGTTTLNDLVVNGTADFTNTKLTNVVTPTVGTDAANKSYVDDTVAAVIDSAPAALDTLNELAAALGDDANFAGTVTTALATKLPLAGGTMTGAIAMGTAKITGLGDPTSAQDAATKTYVDTADATKLSTTGGTMSGAIAMGTNKITGVGDPTLAQDAATKAYTDSILGSATSAADSAAAAATSASNAATSASNAASSATTASNAVTSAELAATNAAASYDSFDDRYLGAKVSDPTLDNDGDALIAGATYFNTSTDSMKVYSGSAWSDVAPVATSVTLSQVTDFPSQSGQSGKYLSTNGTVPNWATLTTDPTLGTLTKTFTNGETASISLTSSVLAPVVSVTKEVPQSGTTNNSWDVNSTTENYTRLDSAAATTLDWVATGDIDESSYTGNSFDLTSQDTSVWGIAFNANGSKMFICGNGTETIYEYNLSVNYDVSTSVYSQSFNVSAQGTSILGLSFNTDGTKMFVSNNTSDNILEYTLSSGFDLSTASYSQAFDVSAQVSNPRDNTFSSDGTKMFVGDIGNDSILIYTLSIGFDVSTASYSSSFSVASQDGTMYSVKFNSDGTRMYGVGGTNDSIYQYNLSTGFDLSTATFNSSFSIVGNTTSPSSIAITNTGFALLSAGGTGGPTVFQYNLALALALGTGSFASADVGKTIEANSGAFVLTATDGSYVETTAPTSFNQVASGSWEMYGVVYNAADGDLELSNYVKNAPVYNNVLEDLGTYSYTYGLDFSNDGTSLYFVHLGPDDLRKFTLSTAWDITTASSSGYTGLGNLGGSPVYVYWKSDGNRFYILDNNRTVYQSDVSNYNISGNASNDGNTSVIQSQISTEPRGLSFNSTGTKMYVGQANTRIIYQYSLSSAWDIASTVSYDSKSLDTSGGVGAGNDMQGFDFSPDGTKLTVVTAQSTFAIYTLTSAYDLSTATFAGSLNTGVNNRGVSWRKSDRIFVIDSNSDVREYLPSQIFSPSGYQPVHTTQSIDSTYWTDINSMTADQAAGDGNVYYAISTDDRTTWTVIDNTDGERDIVRNNAGTWQYNSNGTYASETWVNGATNTELATLAEAMEGAVGLANAFNVNTGSYSQSLSISGQDTQPYDIEFNTDGTKMFVVGNNGNDINEYTLSTAFNVSTATFVDSFSVASQDSIPVGLSFNSDGTKMFVVGNAGQAVYEYTLSAGFDVSTATFVDSFSVVSQDTSPTGLSFNTDGTKMFVVGNNGQDVNEYALSTGFDVSTATYSQNFSVSSQETNPIAMAFNSDGTKMFVVGHTNGSVYQYTLTTGFDLSAASYSSNFLSVSSQDTAPSGIAFNADGSKMFITGATNDSVYEYTIGSTSYPNQMDKTQLDAVTDPNHIALGNDLDLAIVFNMTSGTTVPSSDGVAINYDATVLNKGAVLGTDYDFDAPAQDKVRITALAGNNLKVRVV